MCLDPYSTISVPYLGDVFESVGQHVISGGQQSTEQLQVVRLQVLRVPGPQHSLVRVAVAQQNRQDGAGHRQPHRLTGHALPQEKRTSQPRCPDELSLCLMLFFNRNVYSVRCGLVVLQRSRTDITSATVSSL